MVKRSNLTGEHRHGNVTNLINAPAEGRTCGRQPKLSEEQWAQAGRLLAAGESRRRVALIYDIGLSTLYKKFPGAFGR